MHALTSSELTGDGEQYLLVCCTDPRSCVEIDVYLQCTMYMYMHAYVQLMYMQLSVSLGFIFQPPKQATVIGN